MKIDQHEGKKYLRTIRDARDSSKTCDVDVYSVLKAFNVTSAPTAHAVKKLLCAGTRGKGSTVDDLIGARDAIFRAIEEAVADVQVQLQEVHKHADIMEVDPLATKQDIETELNELSPHDDKRYCAGVVDGHVVSVMNQDAIVELMEEWLSKNKMKLDDINLAAMSIDCPLSVLGLTILSINNVLALLQQRYYERIEKSSETGSEICESGTTNNAGDTLGKIVAMNSTK